MNRKNGIRWKVLVVDDRPLELGLMEQLLRADGYDVVAVETADDALQNLRDAPPAGVRERLPRARPDMAVLDLGLDTDDEHNVGGLEVAVSVAGELPTIIYTRHEEIGLGRYQRVLNSARLPRDQHPLLLFKPNEDRPDPSHLELRQAVHELLVPHVFVVHGHNLEVRDQVKEQLAVMELDAGILTGALRTGQGILEGFRRQAERAHFAIVIFTGDDAGASCRVLDPRSLPRYDREVREAARQLRLRARQNVLFELGYFVALLGPERVLLLYEEGVERPSDYEGIIYVPLDDRGVWRVRMEMELRKAGIARTPYRRG